MQINEQDLSYLYDIYEHAIEITNITKNKKFYHFEKDKMMRFAVERLFEIIGIAAKKLSDETRYQLNTIPWKEIIGLRNVIAHEYGELKIERIWRTVIKSVPELVKELSKIEELKIKN